jgi:hypothetical protein
MTKKPIPNRVKEFKGPGSTQNEVIIIEEEPILLNTTRGQTTQRRIKEARELNLSIAVNAVVIQESTELEVSKKFGVHISTLQRHLPQGMVKR